MNAAKVIALVLIVSAFLLGLREMATPFPRTAVFGIALALFHGGVIFLRHGLKPQRVKTT